MNDALGWGRHVYFLLIEMFLTFHESQIIRVAGSAGHRALFFAVFGASE